MVLSRLRRLAGRALTEGRIALARGMGALARFDRGNRVREVIEGEAGPLGPDIAILCHFDAAGRVSEPTRRYIEQLRAAGLGLVVVTNSGRLEPEARQWLRAQTSRVILRRNIGYDFAAWRDAIRLCALPGAATRRLLLLNDSVYGPFCPIPTLLERLDLDQADVWGLTESWQHRYHLQSYFLLFGTRALHDRAFTRFWSEVRDVRSKLFVVMRYEVGLTQAMMRAGLRCQAAWPYDGLLAAAAESWAEPAAPGATEPESFELPSLVRANARRVLQQAARQAPLNPTADLWLPLLRQGFPFLKRELLCRNPTRVPDVAAWREALAAAYPGGGAVQPILRDLRARLRGRAP